MMRRRHRPADRAAGEEFGRELVQIELGVVVFALFLKRSQACGESPVLSLKARQK